MTKFKTPPPQPTSPKPPTAIQEETIKRLNAITSQKPDRSVEQREEKTVERLRGIF